MSTESLILKVDSTDVNRGAKSLDDLAAAGGKAEKSTNALTSATATLANVAKAAAGMFGLYKLAQYAQEATMLAARFETMGIVMKVAGNNAGYLSSQMEAYSKALQKNGISMLQSRDALTQLATAQIDLAKASEIGRAAQDLAVVAGINSSDAMARMIRGIKSGEVEILKTMGLNVSFADSYKKLAGQLGVNENALTNQQKTLARTNAVLLESKNYAGIYEESMTTAGKAMSSLARYSENLKIKIGDIFLPALADAVFQYTDALKAANAEMDKLGSAGAVSNIGESLAGAFRTVYETVAVLATNIGYVFTTIGNEIGGMAAQIAAVLRGDFAGAAQIRKDMITDAEAGRKAIDTFSERMLSHGEAVKKVSQYDEEAQIKRAAAAREAAAAEAAKAAAAEAAAKAAKKAAEDRVKYESEMSGKLADIEKDRLYAAFAEDKAARIAHSQFLLTVELGRIKDTAQAEQDANQESTNAAIREYLRRGEASAEADAAYVKQADDASKAQTKAAEEQWKKIDGFAHGAFDNIFDKGYDTFKEIGNAIKKYVLDMLYKMTVQKWMISVGIAGTAAATGIGDVASGVSTVNNLFSSFSTSGALASSAGTWGTIAASSFGQAVGLSEISVLAGSGGMAAGSTLTALGAAVPYVAAALAVYSLFGGKKSISAANTGDVHQYYADGVFAGQGSVTGSNAALDANAASLQASYMQAAMALGITATTTHFGINTNTGAQGQNPNTMFWGEGGRNADSTYRSSYYSGEVSTADTAAMQLAASRAVFAALQGSELPGYLARLFDGLTAGAMTQQDIDSTLAFGQALTQMRDALLETRTPLEVLRANVDAGTAAFATSAETFRTDFVAAIDAGINPQVFEQWKALGTAIDQLAAADAESAAQNAEALARAAEDAARYQITMLDLQAQLVELTGDTAMAEAVLIEQRRLAIAELDASDPTGYLAALTTQLWGLQDAADASADAAQTAADALEQITSSLNIALDDARNILRASIDAEKSALQSAYESELVTAKERIDSVGDSVKKLTDLSTLLRATVTSMAVGVTRESAQAQIASALAIARAGGALPDAESLRESIRKVSEPSTQMFTSYVDYMRDFIKTSNDIAALADLTDDQLTEQEQALVLAEDSLEMLTMTYDASIARLDGIWEEATGIRYAVIDVATALANFRAATGAVAAAPQVQGLVNEQVRAAQVAGVTPETYNAMAVASVASELENSIATMYQGILGRAADVSGLAAWASSGLALADIERGIAASAEAQARAISVGAQNTMIEAVNAALGTTTNIRAYATGSNYIDSDQLAMLHRGETVTPAAYVDRDRTARDETTALLRRLVASNDEMKKELILIKSTNHRMWQIEEDWNVNGKPEVREA